MKPTPGGNSRRFLSFAGTPVIAWDNGAVREILEDGVSGFIVHSIAQAVRAAREVSRLDRRRIRQRFEARFTAERMAQDYLRVYARLAKNGATALPIGRLLTAAPA